MDHAVLPEKPAFAAVIALGLALAPWPVACKTAHESPRDAAAMDKDFAPLEPTVLSAEEKKIFGAGCTTGAGACFNDCPSHKYFVEKDPKICPAASASWACYCKD